MHRETNNLRIFGWNCEKLALTHYQVQPRFVSHVEKLLETGRL